MQAFRIGRAVYGIQFHFEAGTETGRQLDAAISPTRSSRTRRTGSSAIRREAAKHGAAADAAGLALARAWIGADSAALPKPRRPG